MTEIAAATSFGPFDRAELEEMKERWLKANIECEAAGDWKPLASFYTVDSTYGWNYGPKKDFMAVGRDEIRDIALGQEMEGLQGWIYPYQTWVIDEKTGDMIGLWKQVYEGTRCLLYTSDAADERASVDLGGRRIIKKKKQHERESEGKRKKEKEAEKRRRKEKKERKDDST